MSTYSFHLDVPFREKDEVKHLGAKWNGKEKFWHYDGSAEMAWSRFEQWAPRLYLEVPYGEKDDAKSLGARWDNNAKKWYIEGQTLLYIDHFQNWLPAPSMSSGPTPVKSESFRVKSETSPTYSTPTPVKSESFRVKSETHPTYSTPYQNTPPKKPSTKSSIGNAKDATTLRISDLMTIAQLKEECQHRGIKGFSGKNKNWMLDQLGVGSVWQHAKVQGNQVAATNKQSSNAAALRISHMMTIAQLKEECQFRGINGTSGKTKDWLLEQLGVGTIWQSENVKRKIATSSPGAKKPPAKSKSQPSAKHPAPASKGKRGGKGGKKGDAAFEAVVRIKFSQ
ncbi:TraC DNA primase [Nitzschia inconspicua]|uniref:TraC DNA primase n=1 Tax=Nitzschia inconspicua TaxID=303405 RepID=A0A9K3M1A8_9STRA|nr:TraC DNA primase [Nitzschia inconspicua]